VKKGLEDLVPSSSAPKGPVAELDLTGMSLEELEAFGHSVMLPIRQAAMGDDDCFSLNEIGTYGLKGACAYASHCHQLGRMDESVMADVHAILSKLASDEPDLEGLLANALKVGEVNGRVLAMLDDAHATTFGVPEPTPVRMTAAEGKGILVSGHDLKDLEALLVQTEGTGVNVYTHGEMLPAHGYPGLKKYEHLAGNYGTAWQNQKFEFSMFPGPIVVTTNCVLEPRRAYRDRLYTMNEVGVDGVGHIGEDRDFSAVIEQAKSMKGFPKTVEPATYHTVGFNHRAVLPLAEQVIEATKSGDLSRIVLIGGCDGSQFDRNYFTELAEELPEDALILTLGCAKNRFIRSEKLLGATLGNGMPRVLDMGQCNDSYSAIVVASELAKALDCTVNDLPLSLALSHLEQKAAAVLLTLLNMGVKNIRLGPSLPAYVTPGVLDVLVENYNLMPTLNAQDDAKKIMAGE
jgi:hydroxylamine reductase